ncbi:MAG TPA: phosphatidylglycerophosphatase A [Povalibacter sp.]|uniref:phosphatidylglycerophosphatase A family protein n=1 Tax=Povalibacter sp. TaxID=1962978 RepID=UPI002C2B78B4|nr:phosphatidylglycerophosphatase A [Povalibacter sp.]HMN46714.1 phosphatidylglycerophosphatase A [Povalibacter sp.]
MKWTAEPRLLRQPVHLLAFGFGAGLLPRAPGTFGTLIAIPIVAGIMQFGWQVHVAFAIAACVTGVWICGESARRLGVHDHSGIVWDEIAGFTITMLAAPSRDWTWWVAGFALFRLFDIWKPWPIREADHRLRGGLGIMLDDILAGLFAAACLLVLTVVES